MTVTSTTTVTLVQTTGVTTTTTTVEAPRATVNTANLLKNPYVG